MDTLVLLAAGEGVGGGEGKVSLLSPHVQLPGMFCGPSSLMMMMVMVATSRHQGREGPLFTSLTSCVCSFRVPCASRVATAPKKNWEIGTRNDWEGQEEGERGNPGNRCEHTLHTGTMWKVMENHTVST